MKPSVQKVGTLDHYLHKICEQLQLTDTQFETAEKRYHRVGEHLTESDTPLDKLSPDVFPQGSMLLRTTVRPMRNNDEVVPFDLDAICSCDVNPRATTSKSLYNKIETRLRANRDFAGRLSCEGKCLRLNYEADDFYLDVIPACKDPSDSFGIRLLIPERDRWKDGANPIDTWKRTDPRRYAAYFDARCAVGRRVDEKLAMARVSPVPPREPTVVKAPLRRVTQLVKRQRDIDFLGEQCRPTSILLTTLASIHYAGEATVETGLAAVLDGVCSQIEAASPRRIVVLNPTDPSEDFALAMTDAAYARFVTMISRMRAMLARAQAIVAHAGGLPKLFPVLAEKFGNSVVQKAFNAVQSEVRSANETGLLGTAGAGGLGILSEPKVVQGVQPVRSHNFHLND